MIYIFTTVSLFKYEELTDCRIVVVFYQFFILKKKVLMDLINYILRKSKRFLTLFFINALVICSVDLKKIEGDNMDQ